MMTATGAQHTNKQSLCSVKLPLPDIQFFPPGPSRLPHMLGRAEPWEVSCWVELLTDDLECLPQPCHPAGQWDVGRVQRSQGVFTEDTCLTGAWAVSVHWDTGTLGQVRLEETELFHFHFSLSPIPITTSLCHVLLFTFLTTLSLLFLFPTQILQ